MRDRWTPVAVALLCGVCAACQGSGEPAGGARPASAAAPQKSTARMATDIPAAITMPDTVDTRLGTLAFKDGFPDDATVQKVYDNLDFQRGVQALLTTLPAASQNAMRRGIRSFGPDNQTVIIFESLMDSRSLFLTANTESIYALTWLNLKDGPVVVESPPNTLGLVDDFWFRYVTDLGNAGPDKGKGGKFLFLPPGYKGNVPAGYHVFRSRTFGNTFGTRGFLVDGDPKPGVDSIKQHLRIYPLAQAASPPAMNFVNVSGRDFSTIHSMDFSFFEEVNQVIQEEPADATDPETLGLLASIGITKGTPFAPDARMKQILAEAASVGQATTRTLAYRTRMAEAPLYPNSAWVTPFIGGSYEFLHEGARILDARSFFFFYATGITPAMSVKMVGAGSQYAAAFVDAKRQPLDGGKTYRLTLPPGIPAKDFWSLVVYDNQTRSQLQTDQQYPSIGSQKQGVTINADTSVDIYFGPKPPAGKESNWVQTWPGKGWNVILRLYGPLQPFFDKTWKPGEIEEMAGAPVPAASKPKMATEIPSAITMPDKVETRLGTLTFKDGFPDDATVQKVYDNLDFQRGVQAFLTAMPAASLSAMREGLRSTGATDNSAVAIFETLADSRSLFLTANTESVYFSSWLDLTGGPMVVESPPNVLGFVDDFWFRYVTDVGNAGPDKGKGGKFLILPPGYTGNVPQGYFVFRSKTFGNWFIGRGFLVNGDLKPAVDSIKKTLRIYPLAQANPPQMTFINVSGKAFNTIHAMDFSFFEEVNRVVQEEPAGAMDPETLGLLASIGIEKGKPFGPDDRMKRILTEAAAVGAATVRTISYKSRIKEARIFPTGSWGSAFVGGSSEFLRNGARLLDPYSSFFFLGTGITPAMSLSMVGVGSQYANTYVDSAGRPLDGGRTYKLTLPAGIPAKDFWSLVLYDTQTRSELQTDQQFPSLGSQKAGIAVNPDKSVDVYFGPSAPPGKESNWVQTMPDKGWFVILRLYGPLQAWFDKTWQPGEIEEMK